MYPKIAEFPTRFIDGLNLMIDFDTDVSVMVLHNARPLDASEGLTNHNRREWSNGITSNLLILYTVKFSSKLDQSKFPMLQYLGLCFHQRYLNAYQVGSPRHTPIA
jgi:hypothetical protein